MGFLNFTPFDWKEFCLTEPGENPGEEWDFFMEVSPVTGYRSMNVSVIGDEVRDTKEIIDPVRSLKHLWRRKHGTTGTT